MIRQGHGPHPWRQRRRAARRQAAARHPLWWSAPRRSVDLDAWRPLYHPQCGQTTCGQLPRCTEDRGCAREPPASRLTRAGFGSSTSRSSSWDCHRHFLHSVSLRVRQARQGRPTAVGLLSAGAGLVVTVSRRTRAEPRQSGPQSGASGSSRIQASWSKGSQDRASRRSSRTRSRIRWSV